MGVQLVFPSVLIILTIAVMMSPLTSSQKITPLTKYGMDLTSVAYDSVCWYEFYKTYPDGDKSITDVQCSGAAKDVQGQIEDKEEVATVWYGKFIKQEPMSRLPSEYLNSCGSYLDDSGLKPASDESDALNDPNSGADFAYKGFAYCLISALRQKYGQKAIDAVKAERTHGKKDWREAAVDKENENRARHGVEPLTRLKELDDGAQLWAEVNAKECRNFHSDSNYTGRPYTGKYMGEYNYTGENLGGLQGYDETRVSYGAMRSWYQEIENYPFPMSFDECTTCNTELKPIGHFTQSVWKDSKFVGYGMAYNKDCDKSFFVARYYPGGNVQGMWGANVFPAKY